MNVSSLLALAVKANSIELVRFLESNYNIKRYYNFYLDTWLTFEYDSYCELSNHNSITQYLYNLKNTT